MFQFAMAELHASTNCSSVERQAARYLRWANGPSSASRVMVVVVVIVHVGDGDEGMQADRPVLRGEGRLPGSGRCCSGLKRAGSRDPWEGGGGGRYEQSDGQIRRLAKKSPPSPDAWLGSLLVKGKKLLIPSSSSSRNRL